MKDEDVKVGMKVVPYSKTTGMLKGLNNSHNWRTALERKQSYLFVCDFDADENAWTLSDQMDDGGDYFNASDFEPYQDPKHATSYVVAGDLPTCITYRHDTYASAEAEAKRLCLKEGKNFRVLKLVTVVEPAQPTVIRVEE